MHVHLIGIGGTGLSAIARVLKQKGYEVSGSDRIETGQIQELRAQGVRVFIGHQPLNVSGADLVLRSSAVTDDNVEVQEALRLHIPVIKRAEILDRLMEDQVCLAVAGTHGKTTTTAMLAWVLSALGADPSYIIGSNSFNLGDNARAGKGKFFVIEADEYDYMFLGLRPKISIVTNIEHDHPDCFPTYSEVMLAFKTFASQTLASGFLIACGEDPGAASLLEFAREEGIQCASYGIGAGKFDFCATDVTSNTIGGHQFICTRGDGAFLANTSLQVPGLHNVRNALACMAVASSLELPPGKVAAALQDFQGTARRFEVLGEISEVTVISDYAHHPSEIQATLSAARVRYPERKIWAVWQPHTYSRTRTLQSEFSRSFEAADQVLVTEVFAAREGKPADGFSSRIVVESMVEKANFLPDLEQARSFLKQHLAPGDVVIILSAGDADKLGSWILTDLADKNEQSPDD